MPPARYPNILLADADRGDGKSTDSLLRNDGASRDDVQGNAIADIVAYLLDGTVPSTVTRGMAETFDDTGSTISVYVDGINGLDTNNGRTQSTALQTIGAVYRKFPAWCYGSTRIVVYLAGIGGFGTNATGQLTYTLPFIHLGGGNEALVNSYSYVGPEMVPLAPSSGPQSASLVSAAATLAPDGATNIYSTLTFAGGTGWPVNGLGGRYVRIKRGGTYVVFEIPVTPRNAANTIIVDIGSLAGLLQAGDVCDLVQPAVKIVGTAANSNILTLRGKGVGFALGGQTNINYPTFLRIAFGALFCTCVHGVSFQLCEFKGETEINGGSVRFWGALVSSGGALKINGPHGNVHDTENVYAFSGSNPINQGRNDPMIEIMNLGGNMLQFGERWNGGMNTFYCVERNISSYDCPGAAETAGSGIIVEGPGTMVYITPNGAGGVGRSIALQGSGNGLYGVWVRHGAKLAVNKQMNTITGSGGNKDTRVSDGADKQWSEFDNVALYNGRICWIANGLVAVQGNTMTTKGDAELLWNTYT